MRTRPFFSDRISPLVFERLQVLHAPRQADSERLRQLRNRSRSAAQPRKHSAPDGVGERLKGSVEGRIVKHTLKYLAAVPVKTVKYLLK